MNTHVAIEIDNSKLASYPDTYLAVCWQAAQHNPAPHGDYLAGQLTERIGREIIRRWLKRIEPELWHHQGRHHRQKELNRFATYEPGGPATGPRAFPCGRSVARTDTGTEDGDG